MGDSMRSDQGFPPAKAIFIGIDALLALHTTPNVLERITRDVWTWPWQAASGVSSSYNALLDFFDCIGNFLKRLDRFTSIPPTKMMTDIIVKIMAELLSVLGLATKVIEQGRRCKCTGAYSSLVAQ